MLKPRIIGALVVKDGIVVQSLNFRQYLPVGVPEIAVDYLNRWGIDEIIVLDIHASREKRKPEFERIARYSRFCHVPLTIGGGISCVEDIEMAFSRGADKVSINTALVKNPKLITQGANLFGSQAIIASIDARKMSDGKYGVFINSGTEQTEFHPADLARKAEELGAGEILINSIDRDGSKQGYDIELIRQIDDSTNIPVIASGGAGYPWHFAEGIKTGAAAVAAANFFHYEEHSVIVLKNYLKLHGFDIRLDSYASYEGFSNDFGGRIAKMDDDALDKLRFEYIPEEII
jgi:cyclase